MAAVPGVQTGSGPFPGMGPGGPLSGGVTQDARLAGRDLGAPYPGWGGVTQDAPLPRHPPPPAWSGSPLHRGRDPGCPAPRGALWEPPIPDSDRLHRTRGEGVTRIPQLPQRRGLEAPTPRRPSGCRPSALGALRSLLSSPDDGWPEPQPLRRSPPPLRPRPLTFRLLMGVSGALPPPAPPRVPTSRPNASQRSGDPAAHGLRPGVRRHQKVDQSQPGVPCT